MDTNSETDIVRGYSRLYLVSVHMMRIFALRISQ